MGVSVEMYITSAIVVPSDRVVLVFSLSPVLVCCSPRTTGEFFVGWFAILFTTM